LSWEASDPSGTRDAGAPMLIDDYARRSLDAQRQWLDIVQEELDRQQ
jgi:hypothetical protein